MDRATIFSVVHDIPHMQLSEGEILSAFIREHTLRNILELGFRHGVSTCYMAGALDDLGGGRITTIDLLDAKAANPNIESLLKKLDLEQFVSVYYEPTSYTWRLMKFLEETPPPQFDLCFIDGAHDWFVDGFAFYLVDKLLLPGGWMIFDDLDWTFSSSPSLKKSDFVRSMPVEEKTTPQIRKVYELLVKTHPSYDTFFEKDGWAYAQKKKNADGFQTGIKREIVYTEKTVGLGSALLKILRRLRRFF